MLKLENIKYLYNDKAIDGLHGINLSIKTGEIIGLMGPSGCGKSTLAKLIAGKVDGYSGQFTCSSDVFYLEESLLDHTVSVLDNFVNYAYGDTLDQKITKARMACSNLEITNYINTAVKNLSTGQKQRVLIGLSLVSNSPFIILDEPFSHLEFPLRKELVEIILPILQEQKTSLLWISHDQKLLSSYCSRIALMNYGEIKQISSPAQLYLHPENLFAADFMGVSNKEYLVNSVSAVWKGKLNIKTHIQNPLLIYRPEAVVISDKLSGQIPAKVLESTFDGNSYLVTLEVNNLRILSRSMHPIKTDNCSISINDGLINIIS